MGNARQWAAGFTIGNKGYIGTGWCLGIDYNDFWEFDPANNAWTMKASFPGTARQGAAGFAINGKGYIGMGNGSGYCNSFYLDFWEYDPLNNAWFQLPNFPGDRRTFATSFTIGNKGYMGTGFDCQAQDMGFRNDFYAFTPNSPLPIELISFDAKSSEGLVKINWSTASETNNNYFEIERSADGKNFESIRKIDGAGNSTRMLTYSYIDEHPLYDISYYRLKQTDYNGTCSFSKMECITLLRKNNEVSSVILFPNPITENIFIKINYTSVDRDKFIFVLSDINGVKIAEQPFSYTNSLSGSTYLFERGNLKSGVYFYQIIDDHHQTEKGKLILQ